MIMKFLNGFKKGTKRFGENINIIINTALLSFVYLVGIGLTNIAARIKKKHFLETKIDPKKASYWSDLNMGKKQMKEYYRQF